MKKQQTLKTVGRRQRTPYKDFIRQDAAQTTSSSSVTVTGGSGSGSVPDYCSGELPIPLPDCPPTSTYYISDTPVSTVASPQPSWWKANSTIMDESHDGDDPSYWLWHQVPGVTNQAIFGSFPIRSNIGHGYADKVYHGGINRTVSGYDAGDDLWNFDTIWAATSLEDTVFYPDGISAMHITGNMSFTGHRQQRPGTPRRPGNYGENIFTQKAVTTKVVLSLFPMNDPEGFVYNQIGDIIWEADMTSGDVILVDFWVLVSQDFYLSVGFPDWELLDNDGLPILFYEDNNNANWISAAANITRTYRAASPLPIGGGVPIDGTPSCVEELESGQFVTSKLYHNEDDSYSPSYGSSRVAEYVDVWFDGLHVIEGTHYTVSSGYIIPILVLEPTVEVRASWKVRF